MENNSDDKSPMPDWFVPPTIEFDGFAFESAAGNWALAAVIDMAYRARRGDAAVAELLTKMGIFVRATEGRSYWPMEDAKEFVATTEPMDMTNTNWGIKGNS